MKKKIIILNNSAKFGGPQKSIIQNINILKNNFEFIIITPKGSSLKNFLENNIKCIISPELPQFENTLFNYYKDFKWLMLFRELVRFFNFTIFLLLNKYSEVFKKIDVVHANEINLLPAIFLTKKILKPKNLVSHCRSLQNDKNTYLSKKLKKLYINILDAVICIDNIVAESISSDVKKKIIYNSFHEFEIIPRSRSDNKFIIGIAGNMADVKGTDFIIETFRELKNRNIKNIFLYFLGDVPKNSFISIVASKIGVRKNYNEYLKNLKNLENIFFLGFRNKIDYFYQNIDLLCFPTQINAVGRTVIEAAQFKVPSLITVNSNITDLDIANIDNSFFFNGRSQKKLADMIMEISKNQLNCKNFGERIFRDIQIKCDAKINSEKLSSIYNSF